MIKKTDFILKLSDTTATQAVLIQSKEDSVLNTLLQEIDGKQKAISGKDWRLVHDDVYVIMCEKGSGITYTLDKASEYLTEALALEAIETLRLIWPSIDEGEIDV